MYTVQKLTASFGSRWLLLTATAKAPFNTAVERERNDTNQAAFPLDVALRAMPNVEIEIATKIRKATELRWLIRLCSDVVPSIGNSVQFDARGGADTDIPPTQPPPSPRGGGAFGCVGQEVCGSAIKYRN
eukprot:Hpha_TRINITY_DN34712_c0_g1::TRINITY_DN34712_c0_g1_i1::g.178026::m.178026